MTASFDERRDGQYGLLRSFHRCEAGRISADREARDALRIHVRRNLPRGEDDRARGGAVRDLGPIARQVK